MLKIVVHDSTQSRCLELAGRVIGPWVEELRALCQQPLAENTGLTLDLEQVSFVDTDGASLLLHLQSRHVRIVNCPRFIVEQLRATTNKTTG